MNSSPTAGHALALRRPDTPLAPLPAVYPSAPADTTPPAEGVIDLRALWALLVRRRGVIALCVTLAVVAGLVVTALTVPEYRASLLMKIETAGTQIVDYGGVTRDEPAGYQANRDFYKTQYELLASRTLARRVIDQLDLGADADLAPPPSPWAALRAQVTALLGPADPPAPPLSPEAARSQAEQLAEEHFLARLSVEPIRDSRLVRVHYQSQDAERAAAVANALAANYMALNLEMRLDASTYAKQFLQEQLDRARVSLEGAERKLAAYAREREIVNTEDRLEISRAQLKDMSAKLVSVEAERIAAEAAHQGVQRDGAEGLEQVAASALIQGLKEQASKLKAEYREQLRVVKPQYPSMQQLQAQIGELETQITRETQALAEGIQRRYEDKQREEDELRRRIAVLKEEALALQDRSTDFDTLRREVTTHREIYNGLLQRMKEVGVTAGLGENNIAIVDAARAPLQPHRPQPALNLALALVMGLGGGLLLAVIRELRDDSLRTEDQIRTLTGAAVLALLPHVGRERLQGALAPAGLRTHANPKSPLAEAIRSLRTQLLFSSAEGVPRVLHVTSAAAHEGKTTAAANLAIAFAQSGARVLLIDGDLRSPSVNGLFGLPNHQGLTNYLTGALGREAITQATLVERLSVITAGPSTPNPVDLLSTARMLDLLSASADTYDLIVLDGPPVMGLADAIVLATLARSTLFVIDAERSRCRAVKAASDRLRQAGVPLLGVVVQNLGRRGSPTAYGYGYGYEYGYGERGGRDAAVPRAATLPTPA